MVCRKCEPSSDSTWWSESYSSSLSINSAACLRNTELSILPESTTTGLSPTDHLQRSDCVTSHRSFIHLMFAELQICPSRIQPDPSKSWISRVRTIKRSVQWDEIWSLTATAGRSPEAGTRSIQGWSGKVAREEADRKKMFIFEALYLSVSLK